MEAARRNSWFVLQPKPDKCMQQLGMPSINFHEVLHKKYIYVYSILGQHTLLWAEDEYGLASSEHFFYCLRWCSTKLNYYHHTAMTWEETAVRVARNQLIACLHTYRQIRQGNRVSSCFTMDVWTKKEVSVCLPVLGEHRQLRQNWKWYKRGNFSGPSTHSPSYTHTFIN